MPSPLVPHPESCASCGKVQTSRKARLPDLPHLVFLPLLLISMICISCGAVGSVPPHFPPVSVTVEPNLAQTFPGVKVQFRAIVENALSPAVNWQVNQVPNGNSTVGAIDSTGLYTAPPNPQTVTVTAVLQSDQTKTGSAIVTIQPLSSMTGPLTVSPQLTSLTLSQALQLSVMIPGLSNGVSNSDVKWAVTCVPVGNCSTGTITQSGLFTAPTVASSNTITASLIANPNSFGSARVEITDFQGTLTWRNDNSRSGANSQELVLSPGTVNSITFGKLFSCPIDGYAYAQPLYVPNLTIPGNGTRNVIFVATEKDSVFAFDADASPCVQLWRTSLIPSGSQAVPTPNSDITSADIVPFIGITGTPVISLAASALYVVAMTQTPGGVPAYDERLYALNLATGQPKIQPAGVSINALSSQTGTFEAMLENQRAALLLDNGIVYVAFGSFHGHGPYHGWLLGYDSTSLQQTGIFNATPNAIRGGIWQSGGGPSADSNHNVFVVTGDGAFDANRGGMSYGDSFVRLGTAGALSVSDYFTPCDQAAFETSGLDLGASAPVLLPDSAGSPSQPHLLVGGSKDGSLYVVNRDNLGQTSNNCPDGPPRVQIIPVGDGPILGTPLYWGDAVYIAAANGKLKSFPISGGSIAATPSGSQSPESLGPQGSTPVISSNSANNAILWLIDTSGALATPNLPAILRAYDPTNLSDEIYNSAMASSRDKAGLAVKFTVPTVANGKVYVGTQTELEVYGLLN